jgi:hypothetical protein
MPGEQHVPPQHVWSEGHIVPLLQSCWLGPTQRWFWHVLSGGQQRPPQPTLPEAQQMDPKHCWPGAPGVF